MKAPAFAREPWRVDRTLTLGVAVALALQTASALMWAGGVRERLAQLETRAAAADSVNERLARLEEHSAYTRAAITRIERKLDEGG
ncbi:hypothetical protein F1654_04645 [Alkalicaulis satelles]|uniref:Uncharacterized protein n=1 Tax=Alkalicaulis satelles TaxID=2609175 RepID=A0A5M6ZKD1_9PROT|nr:hypothetical protein [Alkalicaulis satelles]KAA5805273.1 hypothetical protein F1654_04645 [Alkalicaulis satelles]